ncbi:hypothetical protein CAPTEDRAFT_219660 [Capitella teleta]|uniref:TPM domain-containing protein n=1 Tax=Capitella teleta TaxID=283909 RepID=R7V2X6_CAPTE|nr:hypothetical protein CAPTEDRAFT_219660 [Capitella teleta]|eukprot:ELU13183.1 hypothetical protein CAPTEDRAFT_219660 [Capitella teleta]
MIGALCLVVESHKHADHSCSAQLDPNPFYGIQIELLREHTGSCHCVEQRKCPYYEDDYGGWQASVAIIRKLYIPYFEPTKSEIRATADYFSDYLRNHLWNIGVCDDDFLILLSLEDRVVFTATGSAMSNILTNQCVEQIFQENKHYFNESKWSLGIQSIIMDYTIALLNEHSCQEKSSMDVNVIVWSVIGSCIGVLCIGVGVVICRNKGRGSSSSSTSRSFFRVPSFHYDGGGATVRTIKFDSPGVEVEVKEEEVEEEEACHYQALHRN